MDKVDFEYKINKKFYNEYYARYLLEYFYSDIFKNAKVLDRPDVWAIDETGKTKGVGVEVTTLLDSYYNTLKKYKKMWAEQKLSLEMIAKSIPTVLRNKIGINSHGNLILVGKNKGHFLSKSLIGLETTIKMKLDKLQSYKEFDLNNLFIFATNLNPDCTVEKIFEKIKQIDKSTYIRLYDYIMIFNYDTLQIYPFAETGQPKVYKVNDETKFFCNKLAEMEEKRILDEYDQHQKLKKINRLNVNKRIPSSPKGKENT